MRSYNLAIQHPMCEEMLNYIFSSNINVDLYDIIQQDYSTFLCTLGAVWLNYMISFIVGNHIYLMDYIYV